MIKKTFRKVVSVLMLSVMAVSLTACGNKTTGGADTPAPNESKTELKFILGAEPEILDPSVAAEIAPLPIFTNVFEGLTTIDSSDKVAPGAAESWSVSDDGLVYTFKIREDAKWNDGKPVVAADFIYSWEKIMNAENAAEYAWIMLPYIKNAQKYFDGEVAFEEVGVKAKNDKTLEVTLEAPTSYFPELCAYYTYSPLREDIVSNNPDWSKNADTYISNGPFSISEIKFGEYIQLVKNENYWDNKNVKLEKIQFDFVPDANTALSAFQAGTVDGSNNIPASEVPTLKLESDAFNALPRIQTIFLNINTGLEQFSDVKVREALSLAIDRDLLIEEVVKGAQQSAYGLVPPGISVAGKDFREESVKEAPGTMEENIKKAKELLAEAGYPNGEGFPVIEIKDDDPAIPEVLAKMWEENLGLKSEIKTSEWKVFLNDMKSLNIQVAVGGWTGDFLYPTTFLGMYTEGSGTNYTNWSSKEYDELIQKANLEVDEEKALAMYVEAENMLLNDYPIIPLYYNTYKYMVDPALKGWHLTPLGFLSFKYAYFE